MQSRLSDIFGDYVTNALPVVAVRVALTSKPDLRISVCCFNHTSFKTIGGRVQGRESRSYCFINNMSLTKYYDFTFYPLLSICDHEYSNCMQQAKMRWYVRLNSVILFNDFVGAYRS